MVVVEKQVDRLTLAEQLGATAAIAADSDQSAALEALAPYGFSLVVDATGVPAVIENGFNFLKPRGQFLQFGVTPMEATVKMRPYDIFRNDWTIIGSFALCYTFEQTIAWLAGGMIEVEPLISHTLPLTDFPDAFEQFSQGKTLKVHLQPA